MAIVQYSLATSNTSLAETALSVLGILSDSNADNQAKLGSAGGCEGWCAPCRWLYHAVSSYSWWTYLYFYVGYDCWVLIRYNFLVQRWNKIDTTFVFVFPSSPTSQSISSRFRYCFCSFTGLVSFFFFSHAAVVAIIKSTPVTSTAAVAKTALEAVRNLSYDNAENTAKLGSSGGCQGR